MHLSFKGTLCLQFGQIIVTCFLNSLTDVGVDFESAPVDKVHNLHLQNILL